MTTKTKKRKAKGMLTPGVCRVCGCTESDCETCIDDTDAGCWWVDGGSTLCSACARLEPALKLIQRWADADKRSQVDGISAGVFDDLHELAAALLRRYPLRGPKLLIGADYDWTRGDEMGEGYNQRACYTPSRAFAANGPGDWMYYELRSRKGRYHLRFEGGAVGPKNGFKDADEAARWIAQSENETRMLVAAGVLDRRSRVGQETENAMFPWQDARRDPPPEGLVVETKIDDHHGARNQQPLRRRGNLWFFDDWSMYVYYTPTHWRLMG